MRGSREDGDPGSGWLTATFSQKCAWLNRIITKCGSHGAKGCGQFKSRPSSQCQHCGLQTVPVGYDEYMYDRDYGFTHD